MNSSKVIVCALTGLVLALLAATADAASVRERLVEVARVSEELEAKASALPGNAATLFGIRADLAEDRDASKERRFPRESQVDAYIRARPWVDGDFRTYWRNLPSVEAWPTPMDAGKLRELLGDTDGAVRSLAAEALASLDFPEDVPAIAALLDDESAGVVALGSNIQESSQPWESRDADPLVSDRGWYRRTVRTYAREALRRMTGHRFDGKDPQDTTFAVWWKTNNFGKESFWYWQQRLLRDGEAMVAVEKTNGESDSDFQSRFDKAQRAHRAKLHSADVDEIRKLAADTEAKIYLVTRDGWDEIEVTGPINTFFPEGMDLRIGLPQLMEVVDGKRMWQDCPDEAARRIMLARIARLAPQILKGADDPERDRARIRAALEKEAIGARWMPILMSRLLPAARTPAEMDEPRTREGYQRKALAAATEGFGRESLASEMVRSNLEGQWPVLETVFYSDRLNQGETSDARQGILEALGEEPHTAEKVRVLTALIDDPRNEELFTSANLRMGMDMYRRYAVKSVNAIAGKEVVSFDVLQDLGIAERSKAALARLIRAAKELNDK